MLCLELVQPSRSHEYWAMDFASDGLWGGRKFKALTILDIFTKECLAIEVDTSINGNRVTRVLDRLVLTRGCLEAVTTDNGPEFAGIELDRWTYNNNVRLDFIKPGKPIQNTFIGSFNERLRCECLNQHYFVTLQEAKKIIEGWRLEYNTFRKHSSLGYRLPALEALQLWWSSQQLLSHTCWYD
jgi:putative transposase